MAPRTVYANLLDGLNPLALWDQSLADMGSLGVIPCTPAGTNTIALTPLTAAFAPTPTYANNNQFSFVATATSTNSVTANINGIGAKNVYKADGVTQVGSGGIVSGTFYELVYSAALNSSAGGFYLLAPVEGASSPSGAVLMFPPPGSSSGPWTVIDPYGNAVTIPGTTTTQGLQEALTFALSKGYAFRCYGTGLGTSSGGGAVISCTTPIVLPAIQIGDIRFYDITINFSSAIGASSAFFFDSAEIFYFELNGQIVSQGTGAAVEINPTNQVVLDHFIGFTQNVIYIKAISTNGNSSSAIALKFNPLAGSISQNIITLGEFAGGGSGTNAGYGIQVVSPSNASFVFEQNLLKIGSVHGFGIDNSHGAIQIGTSTTNQANLRGNQWEIGCIRPVNGAHGFCTFGAFDRITASCTNQEGTTTDAFHLNSGAANNTCNIVYETGLSGAVFNDQSTNTTNAFYGVIGVAGQAPGAVATIPQLVGTTAGAGTSSAVLVKSAGQSTYGWMATASGVDAKLWDAMAFGNALQFRLVNDANSIANIWLQAKRSGANLTAVAIGNGSVVLGLDDAAAPAAQTLSVQNVVAGTSNTAGALTTVAGSQGTGTGLGGALSWKVSPPGTTGTAQNALVEGARLTPSSTAPGGIVYTQGVGMPFTPWTLSVAEWRTGTDQRFSLGTKNLLADGVSFNVFNDAISLNLGLEFRASTTALTQGGLHVSGTPTTQGVGVITASSSIKSTGPTAGVGYATGAGGAVTQLTSRTTGVTLNTVSGAITLFAAAPAVGTWVSFTVTDSALAATDTVSVSVKSGTNTYIAHVTTVAAGSFQISFTSIVGTASDSPVINFNVIKGVTS